MSAHHRLAVLLGGIALLSMTACGGGSGTTALPSTTGAPSAPTPTPKPVSSSSPNPSSSPTASPTSTPTAQPTATPTPVPTPTPTPNVAATTVMYVADYPASTVDVYSTGGTPTLLRTLTTNINNPKVVRVDGSGTLYVLNNTDGRIIEYPAGAKAPSTQFYSGFAHPVGMAVSPGGTVYVSGGNGPTGIYVFPSGSTTPSTTIGKDITNPDGIQGLSLDSTGNLYAVGYSNTVASGAQTGTVWMIPGATAATSTDLQLQGLKTPNSVTFDPSGDLVVSEAEWGGTNAMDIYAPGSSTQLKQITSGLFFPANASYDANGTLWVPCMATSAGGSGYVLAFPAGATTPSITMTTGLQGPTSVAFGPST